MKSEEPRAAVAIFRSADFQSAFGVIATVKPVKNQRSLLGRSAGLHPALGMEETCDERMKREEARAAAAIFRSADFQSAFCVIATVKPGATRRSVRSL